MKPTDSSAPALSGYAAELQTLVELDERHDELLRGLEDLDNRVAKVLAEWVPARSVPAAA